MYSIGNSYNENSIRLNLNEFDFEHPPSLFDFLKINNNTIKYYSNDLEESTIYLKSLISKTYSIQINNLMLTAGSDNALEYINNRFVKKDTQVIILTPTYNYFEYLLKQNSDCVYSIPIQLDDDSKPKSLEYHLGPYLNDISESIIYISNPNNPLGTIYEVSEIELMLIKYSNNRFIIDEAYIDFCGVTCIDLVKKYNNIIITRTFSKAYGLAGLRLGFIVTCEEIMNELCYIYNEKNVTEITKRAGIFVLENMDYYKNIIQNIITNKLKIESFFKKNNIYYIKSYSNFITFYVGDNFLVVDKLLESNNIYVRTKPNDIYGFIRVTVGNDHNNKIFLNFLGSIIYLFQNYTNKIRFFTDGCFDGFHYGHVNAIIQAKEQCDVLVLGTHSDQELRNTKGESLFTYQQRILMLKHCKLIDELVDSVDYSTSVKTLDINKCVKYIHSREELRILDNIDPLYQIKKSGRYTTFELTKGISTTNLIFRIHQYVHNLNIPYNNNKEYLSDILNKVNNINNTNTNETHYVYHSWDLLCEYHINYLIEYKKQNNNVNIVACVSMDSRDKNIYNILERAIIIASIREIDHVILEQPGDSHQNWIHADIPFDKNEFIKGLYDKINNTPHLSRKLMQTLRNSAL